VDRLETVRLTKDGRPIEVSLTISPIKDGLGRIIGASTIARDIRDRKRNEQSLRQLTGRLLMLQDEERQRVAAELHDGLGQSLAMIKNRAMIALGDQTNQDRAIEQLEEICTTAASAIREVREIAHNLRPYELDRLGLVEAIQSMVGKVCDTTPIRLSADLDRIDGLLSPTAETSIYRILQEGINNIVKHAEATEARIGIKRAGREIVISVEDNGRGIKARAAAVNGRSREGFGLAGIAERARLLGGVWAIDSEPGRGTTLTVRLAFPEGSREQ
jgi:signal transduction histidine kinase